MSLDKDAGDAAFYPWPLIILNREQLADNRKPEKVRRGAGRGPCAVMRCAL